MLIDLRNKDMTGKDAELQLDRVRITTNKNTIPNDPQSPFITSGIRLGTPAVTSRGMKEADMEKIARAIRLTIEDIDQNEKEVLTIVDDLCESNPCILTIGFK